MGEEITRDEGYNPLHSKQNCNVDRPLSPVLNSSNRDTIFCYKKRRRKTRKHVNNVTEEEELLTKQPEVSTTSRNLDLPNLDVLRDIDSLNNICDKFNKIKQVETERTKFCELLSETNENEVVESNYDFKVPASPIQKRKKTKISREHYIHKNQTFPSEELNTLSEAYYDSEKQSVCEMYDVCMEDKVVRGENQNQFMDSPKNQFENLPEGGLSFFDQQCTHNGLQAEGGDYNADIGNDDILFNLMVNSAKDINFKTAAGKDISVSEYSMKKQLKLFDMFYPNQVEIKATHENQHVPKKNLFQDTEPREETPKCYQTKSENFNSEEDYFHSRQYSEQYDGMNPYSKSWKNVQESKGVTCLNNYEETTEHIIKAADSLLGKFSENLEIKIDGLDEISLLPQTKEAEEGLGEHSVSVNYFDASSNKVIDLQHDKRLKDETTLEFEMVELEKILSQSVPSAPPKSPKPHAVSLETRSDSDQKIWQSDEDIAQNCDKTYQIGNLYNQVEFFSDKDVDLRSINSDLLSHSQDDFEGFREEDYLYSTKILGLCNIIIKIMNEQINIITMNSNDFSKDCSSSLMKEQRNKVWELGKQIEMYAKLFENNTFQNITKNCSNRMEHFKEPEGIPCENSEFEGPIEEGAFPSEYQQQFIAPNITRNKVTPIGGSCLDKIDEVNESSTLSSAFSSSTDKGSDTIVNVTSKNSAMITEKSIQCNPSNSHYPSICSSKNNTSTVEDTKNVLSDEKEMIFELVWGVQKSKKIFEELQQMVHSNLGTANVSLSENIESNSIECQTSEIKQDAKTIQVDSKRIMSDTTTTASFSGAPKFRTASGKEIQISETYLHKTREFLKEISQTEIDICREAGNLFTSSCKNSSEKNNNCSLPKPELSKTIFKYKTNSNLNENLENLFREIGESPSTETTFTNEFKSAEELNPLLSEKDETMYDTIQDKSQMLKETFYDPFIIKETRSSIVNMQNITENVSFKTASGKVIGISDTALRRSKSMFKDGVIPSEDNSLKKKYSYLENIKTASENIEISDAAPEKFKDLLYQETMESFDDFSMITSHHSSSAADTDCEKPKVSNIAFQNRCSSVGFGFKSASGKDITISEVALAKSKTLYEDVEKEFVGQKNKKKTADEKKSTEVGDLHFKGEQHVLEETISKDSEHSIELSPKMVLDSFLRSRHVLTSKNNPEINHLLEIQKIRSRAEIISKQGSNQSVRESYTKLSKSQSKKRLGMLPCKQILIPKHKVEKMKQLFENIQAQSFSPPPQNPSANDKKMELNKKPIKMQKIQETLKKLEETKCLTSKMSKENLPSVSFAKTVFENEPTSPSKSPPKQIICDENQVIPGKNVIMWKRENEIESTYPHFKRIDEELRLQERRLKILSERHQAVCQQIRLREDQNNQLRRPVTGTLYKKKQESPRIQLKDLCLCEMDKTITSSKDLFDITPRSAVFAHFYCPWQDPAEGHSSIVITSDGGTVVPNSKDYIGLPEIKVAFETTPGVNPKLLPEGWINNHYKWIVWKLASMERRYPATCKNFFSVKNVMLQLKYRYDKEIDRAERPALRRILEKDDTSVKRLVLVVSDIIKVAYNKYELELSDGWYSIRTIIDPPLNNLVIRRKIVVGVKVITQCAELLNCEDGCHPLEKREDVRLKISYNCTRPAHWYARLGFQKCCQPFPIPLSTVHAEGGTIGCAKLLIVRVYPVRYREKLSNGAAIWRNEKAEKKSWLEWENQRSEKCEEIEYKVREEFRKEMVSRKKSFRKISSTDISKVHCAKSLFEIMESVNDPESIRELLSSSQQKSLYEYQQKIQAEREEEIQKRIKGELDSWTWSKPEITEVWKFTVFDVYKTNSKRLHNFTIWKPKEDHFQLIKEGRVFKFYNIVPGNNGDLASNVRTRFDFLENEKASFYDEVKRKFTPIASLLEEKPLFNEFDTVGVVVQLKQEETEQELWLTDGRGVLLFIKIMEGAKTCCLLDGLKSEQIVSVCNLVLFGLQDQVVQAIGNHNTVITSNPQASYLQESLNDFKNLISQNIEKCTADAKDKIEEVIIKTNLDKRSCRPSLLSSSVTMNSNCIEDFAEDSTVFSAELTRTDVAMSLIDTQQFY